MSAFIVEDKTINRIVTWVEANARNLRGTLSEFKIGEIERDKHGFILGAKLSESDLQKMANSFLAMNKLAVDDRYRGNNLVMAFRFRREHAQEMQVLKSMQCLRYQCSEGNVPEQPAFKFLERLIDVLMDEIISGLPEYEKAYWG